MPRYPQKLTAALEPIIGAPSLNINGGTERPFLDDRARLRISQRDLDRQQNIERIVELAAADNPDALTETPASRPG